MIAFIHFLWVILHLHLKLEQVKADYLHFVFKQNIVASQPSLHFLTVLGLSV
jgi:hypothetical protein